MRLQNNSEKSTHPSLSLSPSAHESERVTSGGETFEKKCTLQFAFMQLYLFFKLVFSFNSTLSLNISFFPFGTQFFDADYDFAPQIHTHRISLVVICLFFNRFLFLRNFEQKIEIGRRNLKFQSNEGYSLEYLFNKIELIIFLVYFLDSRYSPRNALRIHVSLYGTGKIIELANPSIS